MPERAGVEICHLAVILTDVAFKVFLGKPGKLMYIVYHISLYIYICMNHQSFMCVYCMTACVIYLACIL